MSPHIHDANAQRAYLTLQTSGPRGRELAAILALRRTRVYVTDQITGGLTLNFLNTIFLQPLRRDANERDYKLWVCLLAHEASHIEQNFWVDSVHQEMRAYASQIQVAHELGIDLEAIHRAFGHLNAELSEHREIARANLNRLFGQTSAGIVYASLPVAQPTGAHAIFPALRQMAALVRAAFKRGVE